MFAYEKIKFAHVELTTKCCAICPQCPRTLHGKANPNLPMVEMDLETAKAIFTRDFLLQLHELVICGNYGDPVQARDTLAILKYFKECNPRIKLRLYTNGSGKPAEWWEELARVVTWCRFAVDGLGKMNNLYRRGTDWQSILNAMIAFTDAGGKAEWDFLVFKHNERQLKAALEFARLLGFKKFFPKYSGRFFSWTKGEVDRKPVYDKDGKVVYYLEPPTDPKYFNKNSAALAETDLGTYLDTTDITCRAVGDQPEIYVSAEGQVFPCCWIGSVYNQTSEQVVEKIKELPGGFESISGKRHTVKEIVEGPFFQEVIPGSWVKHSGKNRMKVCARTCGSLSAKRVERQASLI